MSDFFNLIERVFFFAPLIDEVALSDYLFIFLSVDVFASGGGFLIYCNFIGPRGFTS